MVKLTALLVALPCVAAFPHVMEMNDVLQKRTEPKHRKPLFLSHRQNTGVVPPTGFNAKEQFVDVRPGSGHEYIAPGPNDLRGECPGLNAAANHAFLPRNGITSISQTVKGLGDAYNMGTDLALFLAVLSVGLCGDPVSETWSIGDGYKSKTPGVPATGILATHNQYESDASIVKGDAYLNNGDPGIFQIRSWQHFYNRAEEYTLDNAAAQSDYVTRWSILNNPYYFSAPFAGLVSPAAHNFVINFMSNRSESNHGGVLNREVLKSFFAVTGDKDGEFVYHQGKERIPYNWYKRPLGNAYNIPEVLADVFVNNAMYPGIVRFGGNTGKTNSFAGVDIDDLTGGVYNAKNLEQGNNAACFFLQASTQGLPEAAQPGLGEIGSVLDFVTSKLGPLNKKFGCPELKKFNESFFNQFPGAKYKGKGETMSYYQLLEADDK